MTAAIIALAVALAASFGLLALSERARRKDGEKLADLKVEVAAERDRADDLDDVIEAQRGELAEGTRVRAAIDAENRRLKGDLATVTSAIAKLKDTPETRKLVDDALERVGFTFPEAS